MTLEAEHGFGVHGEEQVVKTSGNAFTMLHHAHVGGSWRGIVEVKAHYMHSFDQDSKAADPEGSLDVLGVEGRLAGGIGGELYLGYASAKLRHALRVGPILESVHSLGGNYLREECPLPSCRGLDFNGNFLGPGSQGNGTVNTIEFNYEYSFGLLWRKILLPGAPFTAEGADIRLGVFGMYTTVESPDVPSWNGIRKFKFGGDLSAALLPWLGLGVRYDRVQPNLDDGSIAFAVVSPRLVFRMSWNSHEQIAVVYSHYEYGSALRTAPIANDMTHPGLALPSSYGSNDPESGTFRSSGAMGPVDRPPDRDVISLKATTWW